MRILQKSLFTLCIFSSLWAVSCSPNHKNVAYTHDTKLFQQYLMSTFHQGIAKGRHFYFLVPGAQCHNCNFYDAGRLKGALNQKLIVITELPSKQFTRFYHILQDTVYNLNSLPIVNYSNQLLVTDNGQITGIYKVKNFYKQLDSLYTSGFQNKH